MKLLAALLVLVLVVAVHCSDSDVLAPARAPSGLRGGDELSGVGVDDAQIEAVPVSGGGEVTPSTTCDPKNALCVTVREKPLSAEAARAARESADGVRCIKNMRSDGEFLNCDEPVERDGGFEIMRRGSDTEVHNYDSVFTSGATNPAVYTGLGSDLVEKAFKGHNVAMFAYGSTGSGKTYSMGFDPVTVNSGNEGIMQFFLDDLLARNRQRVEEGKEKYDVEFSAFQIYSKSTSFGGFTSCRKAIYNLCMKDTKRGKSSNELVEVFPNGSGTGSIHSKIKQPLTEKANILRCLENRATADNGYNDMSSRSFAVIQLSLSKPGKRGKPAKNVSNMFFIDLAGSEDVNSYLQSVADKEERKKEGLSINTGLLNLGMCMRNLGSSASCAKTTHPLVFSLYDDLFDKKMKGMVWLRVLSTVRMEPNFLSDTAATLKFTSELKNIKVTPVDIAHVDDDDVAVDYLTMIKNLQAQVVNLKKMNDDAQDQLRRLREENEHLAAEGRSDGAGTLEVAARSRESDPDVCFQFLNSTPLKEMTLKIFKYVNSFEEKHSLLIAPPKPDVENSFWENLFGESGTNKEKKAKYQQLLSARQRDAQVEIDKLTQLKNDLQENEFEQLSTLIDYDPHKHKFDYAMRTTAETFPRIVACIANIWSSLQNIADSPASNKGLLLPLVGGLVTMKRTVCELWRSLKLSLKVSARDGQTYEYSDLCEDDRVQIIGSESGPRESRVPLRFITRIPRPIEPVGNPRVASSDVATAEEK